MSRSNCPLCLSLTWKISLNSPQTNRKPDCRQCSKNASVLQSPLSLSCFAASRASGGSVGLRNETLCTTLPTPRPQLTMDPYKPHPSCLPESPPQPCSVDYGDEWQVPSGDMGQQVGG
ncbi:protein phosphatase 1 regulatory subunit 14D isoform X2 [Notamacropus eugenii]|uniref:protein phosphatase 1 regulatory subunit 14D isoform X2 n=1 Tax=Notamacropus eugenii TaxID=9315 RepID=UPI003B679BD2